MTAPRRSLALAGLLTGMVARSARADLTPGPTEIGAGVLGVAVVVGAAVGLVLLVLRLRGRGRKKD